MLAICDLCEYGGKPFQMFLLCSWQLQKLTHCLPQLLQLRQTEAYQPSFPPVHDDLLSSSEGLAVACAVHCWVEDQLWRVAEPSHWECCIWMQLPGLHLHPALTSMEQAQLAAPCTPCQSRGLTCIAMAEVITIATAFNDVLCALPMSMLIQCID